MEPSSSSKVTVEYLDPSGVYPLVSSSLLARLPLRNLHWKSATRPLRSIASLHVDLISHEHPSHAHSASTSDVAGVARGRTSTGSGEEAATRPWMQGRASTEPKGLPDAGPGGIRPAPKERRHQIPGLRQTPYLKVYLLRCDDNDTYKSSARKVLREWVKTVTPSSSTTSSNAQENHDAFDWLIVHVILPNSLAGTAGSNAGAQAGSGSTEKQGGGPRWPGKGSSTVYEKIRADFNSSSKSGLDRVAQIRLHETDIPPHLLPDSAGSPEPQSDESQQDRENAWSDLIAKFRSLILASFDRRVAQYEEDIRQRDAQRHLPGWNFCTFFILKEGLARGFESVGLLEDALVMYDELAAGLDVFARDAVAEDGEIRGSTFVQCSDDLRHRAQAAQAFMNTPDRESGGDGDVDGIHEEGGLDVVVPLDDTLKRYRDLILSNQISLFDFRCYLFARQMSLLLRQANAWSSVVHIRSKLMAEAELIGARTNSDQPQLSVGRVSSVGEPEDLAMLAELCRRAVEFLPSAARVMRADLRNGLQPAGTENAGLIAQVIENMLCSWLFSASRQILAETSTTALPLPPSLLSEGQPSNLKSLSHGGLGQEPKTAIVEPKTMMPPTRRSSLMASQDFQSMHPAPVVASAGAQASPYPPKNERLRTGIEDLAYFRAELYLLERNALKRLGSIRGWSADLASVYETEFGGVSNLQEVSLDDEDPRTTTNVSAATEPSSHWKGGTAGIDDKLLRDALENEDDFYRLYEIVSDRILRHFSLARKIESMETTLADLAVLKYRQKDFATAAGYFSRLEPFYTERGWNLVGTSMLQLQAKCLKELDRRPDSIRVLLELIARAVKMERRAALRRRGRELLPRSDIADNGERDLLVDNELFSADGYISDLAAYSRDLPYEITVPLNQYFADLHVEPYARHLPDRDGFQLRLRVTHLLPAEMTVDKVTVKLVAASSSQGQDMLLENNDRLVMKRGVATVLVGTHTIVHGPWILSHVTFRAHKIVFTHDALTSAVGPSSNITSLAARSRASVAATKGSVIHFYPRPSALAARLELPRHISLDQSRSIEVVISSGWNDITRAELRIRAASAGLRLQTANARVRDGEWKITNRPRPGALELGKLSTASVVRLRIPFALERDLPELSARIELDYWTERGQFFHSTSSSVSITSPLGVNVQDLFTRNALFSKFTVSTASSVPLHMLRADLNSHGALTVSGAPLPTAPQLIVSKQPASLVWKIMRGKKLETISSPKLREQHRLALTLTYRSLDEEISSIAESTLLEALEASPHRDLSPLLTPALLAHLRKRFSPVELEMIGLLGGLELGAFEDIRWDDALRALPPDHAAQVRQWLRSWHQEHHRVELSTALDSPCNRTVTLPVEVPSVQVVHTADLILVDADGAPLDTNAPFTVGQMLTGELRLSHTRAWDQSAGAGAGSGSAMDFAYEVQVESETWLVGGLRRGQFHAEENELHRFPVMLLPLRPGHLILPSVVIRPVVVGQQDSSTHPPADPATKTTPKTTPTTPTTSAAPAGPIRCETHHLSQAQTIMVLPDVVGTTVTLESSGRAGSTATLVDTQAAAAAAKSVSVSSVDDSDPTTTTVQ